MLLSELIEILEKKKKEYGDAEVFSSKGLYKYPIQERSIEAVQYKYDNELEYHTKYFLIK